MRPERLKRRISKVHRESMSLRSNFRQSSLVGASLRRGNRWFWWWPDGMKMSGFVGDGSKGRLVEITL